MASPAPDPRRASTAPPLQLVGPAERAPGNAADGVHISGDGFAPFGLERLRHQARQQATNDIAAGVPGFDSPQLTPPFLDQLMVRGRLNIREVQQEADVAIALARADVVAHARLPDRYSEAADEATAALNAYEGRLEALPRAVTTFPWLAESIGATFVALVAILGASVAADAIVLKATLAELNFSGAQAVLLAGGIALLFMTLAGFSGWQHGRRLLYPEEGRTLWARARDHSEAGVGLLIAILVASVRTNYFAPINAGAFTYALFWFLFFLLQVVVFGAAHRILQVHATTSDRNKLSRLAQEMKIAATQAKEDMEIGIGIAAQVQARAAGLRDALPAAFIAVPAFWEAVGLEYVIAASTADPERGGDFRTVLASQIMELRQSAARARQEFESRHP